MGTQKTGVSTEDIGCAEPAETIDSADYKGRRVLITGAGGFIGTHLCRRLIESGATLFANDIGPLDESLSAAHCLEGDITNLALARSIIDVAEPDTIFHLASLVSGNRDLDVVVPAFEMNLRTTVNILTAAAQTRGCRIILAGSLEEPDSGELDPIPCSPYAAAKWASSGYARMFRSLYKMQVMVARIFMVYGPGQFDLQKLIPYVIHSLLRGEAPKLGSGLRPLDWIFVDDVVDGLIALANSSACPSRVELGTGKLTTIRGVVETIVDLLRCPSSPAFGAREDRPLECVRVADAATTYDAIGWRPRTPLKEGLASTIAWYEERFGSGPLAHAAAATHSRY
jgi:UDP-glucose 4-epimerase